MLVVLLSISTTGAQTATEIHKKYNLVNNDLAIKGYDPVAYFTFNKAKKGNKL
ncbi:hypothetical protein [Mucilaginibacter jinjuensis]|uniref:Uncharacterized protein n=1 Tax=Mucilaginibacter jinjuensis TaxID=1176721 RepID=A0ABY7TES4_9SPHI|nr:hypothetical protein [Mucilaginibacter jinjuensis]WCT14868.1 hypothetical protein PQO05_13060 [Mucilaginibacter jinjuensis]